MDKSSLKPGHLKRIKSLASLDDTQLAAFLNYIEVLNLAQPASLFKEGQPGDSMFLILEGQMRVSTQKRNSDELLFLRKLEAGDSFGEIALLSQAPRSATVEATQNSVLIKISAASLQKLLSEQPALAAQFLYHLAKTLGRELSDLTTKLRVRSEQADLLSHCS
jgi:CRP-like cAMP-binding protein